MFSSSIFSTLKVSKECAFITFRQSRNIENKMLRILVATDFLMEQNAVNTCRDTQGDTIDNLWE